MSMSVTETDTVPTEQTSAPTLLEIDDLQVGFETDAGLVHAVDGVSLLLSPGRTLGLVGESGCGKSVTALSILRLVPSPPGKYLGGAIRFNGEDLLQLPRKELPNIRGSEISMIFQDPMTSLNPVFTIEKQMGEVLRLKHGMDRLAARKRSVEMLDAVGIPDPETRLFSYPHELSGGMKQRVMIAMALMGEPKLLIADEPTTALDVTIQAQILELIRALQKKTGTAVLFITHNMGVVAEMCDEVAVMYAGRVVEQGKVIDIFENPQHPYTKGLLDCIPRKGVARKSELSTIEGIVPSLLEPPKGCRFADRCDRRKALSESDQARCIAEDPRLKGEGHIRVACHFPLSGDAR
jgi:oligopeptide/dipeptide ABC transporter ATP-binding protein